MSARDWLYARLTGACIDPERVSAELDAFRAEVLNEAIEAARSEYLEDNTGTPDDEAYDNAISDVVAAIGALLETAVSPAPVNTTDGEMERPNRFTASPAQVDDYLRRILCEDTLLNYQRVVGNRAAEEAAKDLRMIAAKLESEGEKTTPREFRYAADEVDPLKGGGPYPSVLLCGKNNGFGPCPGAPRCTPRDDEPQAGAR